MCGIYLYLNIHIITEILDTVLTVVIMASCVSSVLMTPEWRVFAAPDREWRQFQEYSLTLYHICAGVSSHKLLTSIMNMWFTGKKFKNRHYGKKFEEMEQSPRGWNRPFKICKNIELLEPVNRWCLEIRTKYRYPCYDVDTVEGREKAKEFIATLPTEFKPLSIIRIIRDLPGWIGMDSPDMYKEVMYFMTHLMRTEYGARLIDTTRYLYDLDQHMPCCIPLDRICNGIPMKHTIGFFNYRVKFYKKRVMKKTLSTSNSGSTISIIDSLMGWAQSIV